MISSHRLTVLLTSLFFCVLPAIAGDGNDSGEKSTDQSHFKIQATNASTTEGTWVKQEDHLVLAQGKGSLTFKVNVPVAGRYQISIDGGTMNGKGHVWLEDYIYNTDGRTYNITGKITIPGSQIKHGSPLNAGTHDIRLHAEGVNIDIHSIQFRRMVRHQEGGKVMTQNTAGENWEVVWSDEFNGKGLVDTANWTYDIGNWGWGNNELQYYTAYRTKNARQEDGNLIIEAHRNDMGQQWTSARLTSRGKVSFTYGKIEFRAKVPAPKGCWAAGWTLGAEYVDEVSWPYCGEIDILESVGFETNDATGDGIAHASAHTRGYYFKQGNHLTSQRPVTDISESFHTYSVEWDAKEIRAYVDGVHYYTYDKHDSEEAWPFDDPQVIILNLTMGGGWGGEIAEGLESAQYIIDYVRVYERR